VWIRDCIATDQTQRDEDLDARASLLATLEPDLVFETLDRWRAQLWMRGATVEDARARTVARGKTPGSGFDPLPLFLVRRLKHVAVDIEFLDDFRRAYGQWTRRRADPVRSGSGNQHAKARALHQTHRDPSPRGG